MSRRSPLTPTLLLVLCALPASARAQDEGDVPVTIKELDVEGAIREFQAFQQELVRYKEEIGQGRVIANETAQILEELRSTANEANDFNEGPILQAVSGYIDGVVANQVELVDFLESQRYRITYYANKMASSLRPEQLELLFGSEEQNRAAIEGRVRSVDSARRAIADYVDRLPDGEIDRETFRPLRTMAPEARRKLDTLVYSYQQERNALELAKKRLQLVRAAGRTQAPEMPEIDADLLVGQMFHALDRIRLQMSLDLMYLESLLGGYAQSARTQEILEAFQSLVEMQGDLEGPSPELSSVLDWLQDTSTRRISLSARNLERPGLQIQRYNDLLREAYEGARAPDQ